jgi:thiol:disulfide interchange protein
MRRIALAFLAVLWALPAAALDSQPKVHARLVAEHDAVAPGGTVTVALELDTRAGWHTYWLNAGDAGAPTEIHWTLPAGWKAGPIQWPYPQAEAVGPLMDYGYEGKPWLLVDITAPKDAKPDSNVALGAQASWLVCAEVCVPEDQTVTLPLSVGTPTLPPDPAFVEARAKLPVPSPWPMRYAAGKDGLDLFVQSSTLAAARPAKAEYFPATATQVAGIAPQRLGFADDGLVLRLAPAKGYKPAPLDGVLLLSSADGSVQALTVHAQAGAVPQADFGGGASGLWLALAFAFLGGLILNLMPCVLPVLAMKALAIADSAHKTRGEAMRESLAYGTGAVLSFLALGGAVIALRAGGAAIGWGFQLQEPAAVAGFALLVFAIGLSLLGVFEVGTIGAGDSLAGRGGAVGSFFTGVLAVAVAAPCTAPFMAAALGFALTEPAPLALAVFLSLGLGFALPFVAVAMSPALLRLLPKPGMWMVRFKQVLSLPMFVTAAWLVWVLSQETGPLGVPVVLGAMVALGVAAWLWQRSRAGARGWQAAALVLGIAALASLPYVHASALSRAAVAEHTETAGIPCEAYSPDRLARYRAEKRAVFVDATASWCITCLVNEKVAFSGAAVHEAFAKNHIAYLLADWTNRDPAITALLEAHGRPGVPLYLYYAPGAADAVVLPQILTEGEVLKVVNP